MTKVLTFGTFDGIHEGHRAMLRQAKALGDYLIVIVAADDTTRDIKGALPKHSSAQRITMLKKERLADDVVSGDDILHSWKIVKKYKPDIIALGYDQDELKQALTSYYENAEKKPIITTLSHYDRHRTS